MLNMRQRYYYFIRHAIPLNDVGSFHFCIFNKDMVGEINESLSMNGEQQAYLLKNTIQNLNIGRIISSSKKRAIETARIISNETGIPFNHQYKQLDEINIGMYSIQNDLLIRILSSNRWPGQIRKIYDQLLSISLTLYYFIQWRRGKTIGGESLHVINQKIEEVLHILDSFPEERIAIVSHGGWISFLAVHVLGGSQWNFLKFSRVKNCSVTRIDSTGEGQYHLRFFARSMHYIGLHPEIIK